MALGVSSLSAASLYLGLKKEAKELSTEHEESFDLSMVRLKIEGDSEGTNLDGHEIRLTSFSHVLLLLLLATQGSVQVGICKYTYVRKDVTS